MKSYFSKTLWIVLLHLYFAYPLMAKSDTSYTQKMAEWEKGRNAALLDPNGWINLVGLFWLQPGTNRFGSSADNELVVNNKSFPPLAGQFEWKEGKVTWTSHKSISIKMQDSIITSALVFDPSKGISPVLAIKGFRFNIIKREEKIGVRFRDLNTINISRFKGVKRFALDEQWRIMAHLETGIRNDLMITNVLGQTQALASPGKLVFTINGERFQLDALEEDGKLFIVFGDATSGKETYPAGRFLYALMPDEKGYTLLDFNQSINPPCAFSAYATCPLPPKQNILPFAVTAGEKDFSFSKIK